MENLPEPNNHQEPAKTEAKAISEHLEQPPKPHKERIVKDYDKQIHGKRYSIAQKLAIKAMQGSVSIREAEPLAGVNQRTIRRIWEDPELDELAPNVVSKTKIGLGGLFYKRALGAALAISPEKLEQSSALQLATVAGIMTEKGRLMEGLSTENLSFKGVTQAIEDDRAKLMKRLEALDGEAA